MIEFDIITFVNLMALFYLMDSWLEYVVMINWWICKLQKFLKSSKSTFQANWSCVEWNEIRCLEVKTMNSDKVEKKTYQNKNIVITTTTKTKIMEQKGHSLKICLAF